MASPRPLATLPLSRLDDAASGLRKMHRQLSAASQPTVDIESAFDELVKEYGERGVLYDPLVKAKGKKSGKGGKSGWDKDNPSATTHPAGRPGASSSVDNMMGKSFWVTTPDAYDFITKAGSGAPHSFVPVRNICRTCRSSGDSHDDDNHDFVPVRNVCRLCGQDGASHVSKWLNLDDSYVPAAMIVAKAAADLASGVTPQAQSSFGRRDYSVQERQEMAEKGLALPDGSFPIANEADLHDAVRLVGQAGNPQEAMNHIIERAKNMGMVHALPPAWNVPDVGTQTAPMAGPGAHGMAPGVKPGGAGGPGAGGGMGAGAGQSRPASPFMTKSINLVSDFSRAVIKSTSEHRYTLAPVYLPKTYDAHEEWATAEDLEKSVWDYVKATGGDRTVFLQHSPHPAGEWVNIVCWPSEVQATVTKSINGVRKAQSMTFPAGTAYMGVLWQPWAWEMVKNEEITGLSMGGLAGRIEAEIG